VARRVSPTERLRAEIDELFASDRELASILEDVARLSVRSMMQSALEAEVEEFLGRARYQRRTDQGRPGSRNGWQPPTTVHTTMGAVALQRPKLRGTDQAFCSRLFGAGMTRTNALESLVISGWVRGLSDRDIQAALAEVLGAEAALSKSTVSRICQRIGEEFQAWRHRDLSMVRLDYPFLDGSHFKTHPGAPAEPVLAAWGIDTDGKPVLVGLAPAASESTDAWDDFLADLTQRGLRAPLLGISDGAPGLTGAFDRAFPNSLRQRCLVHRARNTLAKVSAHDQDEVKADSGPSSTSATPSRARRPSPSPTARRPTSRPSGSAATPPRSRASPTTSPGSRCTCGSRPSTGTASVTPTSSSAPSARPAGAPRSSAGSPARARACRWCGRCSTAPAAAGAASR
jgi:putative transposase